MFRVFLKASVGALCVAVGLAFMTWRWIDTERADELVALSERSAVALDQQFSIWKTALSALANSYSMVREFDVDTMRWEAERITKDLNGWAVLLPADDTTQQAFNTLLPGPVSAGPASPELLAAIARSQRSRRPEMTDVFVGRVAKRPVVAVVQYVTVSTGKDYVIGFAFEVSQLSNTLTTATLPDGYFISVVDGSNRVVARSSRMDDFFLRPLPDWFVEAIRGSPSTEPIILRGEAISGNDAQDYVFARSALSAAPGWGVSVATPSSAISFASALFIPTFGYVFFFGVIIAVGGLGLANERRKTELEAAFARSESERTLRQNLEVAMKDLHAAEAARADMLGVLGHEMRTPVLSAIAALQVFPETLKAQDERHSLALAEKGLQLLQSLIEDILDLSRMKAGEFSLNNNAFSLPSMLRETADIMAPEAERHKVPLECSWPTAEMMVIGDSTRIRQILINLLSNAFRYTPEGAVTLRGSWQADADGTCHILLSVTDTGIGIAEGKLKDVFRPFVRLDEKSAGRTSGLGLGLPISDRLATAMGGRIDVTSRLGQGSTFRLTLDLPVVDGSEGRAETAALEQDGIAIAGLNILLVEDQPLQAAFAVSDLKDMHAKTTLATTGKEALDAVHKDKFDVILIDLGLPDMSGVELVQKLKDVGSPALHIAFSANPDSLSSAEKELFDATAPKTGTRYEVGHIVQRAVRMAALADAGRT